MAMRVVRPLFYAQTEIPHHHEVDLFRNSPHDRDHLILRIAQRTTKGGQAIRLHHDQLTRMWRWLNSPMEDGPNLDQVHVQATVLGQHVDTVTLSAWLDAEGRPGDLLISIVRRADAGDTPGARAVLDAVAADRLRSALHDWIWAWIPPVMSRSQGG